MKIYKAYAFRAKDPVIGELRRMIETKTGNRPNAKGVLDKIEKAGGPSRSAMNNWFFGKTMRPNNCTVEAAGRALGFERVWKKQTKDD